MSGIIYLYGKGETEGSGVKESCYLACTIPDNGNEIVSGFFPSVLHSYMMYAKDIGLEVSDVIYEGFESEGNVERQLVYSLWPIMYVNNSEIFTEGNKRGVVVWSKPKKGALEHKYSVVLDKNLAFYYRKNPDNKLILIPDLNLGKPADNPIPKPNNTVSSDTNWYLSLTLPLDENADNKASTFSIVQHYNQLIVWSTIKDISDNINQPKSFAGMKQATGKVLQAVTDRQYAYDAIVPNWSNSWSDKPEWYDNQRNAMNNYNIGACLFTYQKNKDPDSPNVNLTLFSTALNIKGSIKAGHAETRLLLTLDALNFIFNNSELGALIVKFYNFNNNIDFSKIFEAYKNKSIALISSLKPCYLCVGETDASVEGKILTIDGKPVDMWSNFPGVPLNPTIKNVIYFDIDKPIDYYSNIKVSIKVEGKLIFTWNLSLSQWEEWSASFNNIPESIQSYVQPIGPRIVEPAGECLKTGYAYTRYLNSEDLLLNETRAYIKKLNKLVNEQHLEVFD